MRVALARLRLRSGMYSAIQVTYLASADISMVVCMNTKSKNLNIAFRRISYELIRNPAQIVLIWYKPSHL